MFIYNNGVAGPGTKIHAKNGATLDPSSVTPITTPPVVSAPTGDGTYLRIDGGNSPVTGSVTFSSSVYPAQVNNQYQVNTAGAYTLASAVSAIGSNPGSIKVTSSTTVSADLTIPSNVSIEVSPTATITINSGKTLTFSHGSQIVAGRYQIFAGSGSVAGLGLAYPEWWQNNTTPGTTDMASAIQTALGAVYDSATQKRGVVSLGPVDYRVQSTTLNMAKQIDPALVGTTGGGWFHGTRLLGYVANKPVIDIVGSLGARIKNVDIVGFTSTIGILMGYDTSIPQGQFTSRIEDVTIIYDTSAYGTTGPAANSNLGTVGIMNIGGENVVFHNINVQAILPMVLSGTNDLSWVRGGSASTFTASSQFATLPTDWTCGVEVFSGSIVLEAFGFHRPALAMSHNTNAVQSGWLYCNASAVGDGHDGNYKVGVQIDEGFGVHLNFTAETVGHALEIKNVFDSQFHIITTTDGTNASVVNLYGGSGAFIQSSRFLSQADTSSRYMVDVDGTSPSTGNIVDSDFSWNNGTGKVLNTAALNLMTSGRISDTANTGEWVLIGPGSTTTGYGLGLFENNNAAAANLLGLGISRPGTDTLMWGINGNSASSGVPANALYFSSYNSTSTLCFGRGLGNGMPGLADLVIGSGGAVTATNGIAAATSVVTAATPSTAAGQVGFGTTAGFGNGSSGTAMTTTAKGTGSGPTTAQTVVKYLKVNIAGTDYWIPLVQ